MDINAFLERYYSTASDDTKLRVTNWIKYVEESAGLGLSKEVLQSKDKLFYCSLFTKGDTTVARTKYFMVKSWLQNLLNFYDVNVAIPSREDILDTLGNKNYFKDLKELLDYIDYSGDTRIPNYRPASDMLYLKSLCILGWYGFSQEEIVALLISDLRQFEGGYYIKRNDTLIPLTDTEFQIIKSFSLTDCCQGYPSGKLVYYKDTHYLFRPVLKSDNANKDSTTVLSIKTLIKKFNNNNPRNINISFVSLRKNRVFTEIYNDKTDIGLSEKIAKHFGSDANLTINLKKEYTSWVKNVKEI